jgi:hypothetical protein
MLQSGLAEVVADEEDLARFLTQSSHFTAEIVKHSALLPSPKSKETSVSRHGRTPLDSLWALGREAAGSRHLYGAAIFKAAAVRAATLGVEPREPPPRHAVILAWPWTESDPDLQRAKRKELAILIASAAGAPVLR